MLTRQKPRVSAYQTLINALLCKAALNTGKAKPEGKPLTVATLRRVLREELQAP